MHALCVFVWTLYTLNGYICVCLHYIHIQHMDVYVYTKTLCVSVDTVHALCVYILYVCTIWVYTGVHYIYTSIVCVYMYGTIYACAMCVCADSVYAPYTLYTN